MYPSRFRYHRPESLAAAVALLAGLGEGARVLAGGQSLIPLMKHRLLAPTDLVDLKGVAGLDGAESADGRLRLGALTRHASVDRMALPESLAIVHDATSIIADVQVRNRGTIGGSLAQADAGGDWAPVLLALDATVECVGPGGERAVPVREWFVDAYETALAPGEIVRGVVLPLPAGHCGGAYLALKRRAGDYAVASAAVQLRLGDDGRCAAVGIGLGSVGVMPLRARRAEEVLRGSAPDAATVAAAAAAVMEAAEPLADVRGPAEYKREVVGVLFRRAVEVALKRSFGEQVDARAYV